jgi:hypothetical protein
MLVATPARRSFGERSALRHRRGRRLVTLAVVLGALSAPMAELTAHTIRGGPSRETAAAPFVGASAVTFLRTRVAGNFTIDPSSSTWANQLADTATDGLWVNYQHWAPTIYHANARTPRVSVYLVNTRMRITIPWLPKFRPDDTTDAQIAVIDDSTGCDYEFQGFDPSSLGAHGEATFHVRGTGLHANDAGVTGSNISLLAGLITPRDVKRGVINHALRYATPIGSARFVLPASRSDGRLAGGIPAGELMRLEPDLDLRQFQLTRFQLMVAKALKRYGAYNADAAGTFTLYAENTIDGSRYSSPISPLPTSLIRHLEFGRANYRREALTTDTNHDKGCSQQHH